MNLSSLDKAKLIEELKKSYQEQIKSNSVKKEYMEWKYWSYRLRCKIEKEASTRLPSGETIIDPDKLNELKIKYLLVDWSFTDESGNKIPLKRTGDALDPDSLEKVLSLDPNILMAFLAELNAHLYLLKNRGKKISIRDDKEEGNSG